MRLFLAVPVPLDLTDATEPLRGEGFRAVPSGSWHMTVRFLGETDPDQVVAAMDGLDTDGPLDARFTEAGAFPDPRRARVAWLGVDADGLAAVAHDAQQRLDGIGVEDRKQFVAHVTLGRWKRSTDARMALQQVDVPRHRFRLDRVDLMASELTPEGPEYSVVETWPLGQSAAL